MPEVKKEAKLLPFLFEEMPAISRSRLKQFLRDGRILVNGKSVTQHDTPLAPGDKVVLSSEKTIRSAGLNNRYVSLVYEDRHLVVVEKRDGILSMATSHHSFCIKTVLDNYFERTRQHCRAHLVHRLDRDTSGLMLFAKNRETQQRFEANWKELVYDRRYVAAARGMLTPDTGTVTSWLKDNKQYFTMSSPVDNGGKLAITHYKVLQRGSRNTLVELRLETGRKNQIRVHLSDLHHPVVGDHKYGIQPDQDALASEPPRMYLHAFRLYFRHPITGEELHFSTPIPSDFLAVL
jgi:23S rRNA pseudouridine1911/1915/1917 synthase